MCTTRYGFEHRNTSSWLHLHRSIQCINHSNFLKYTILQMASNLTGRCRYTWSNIWRIKWLERSFLNWNFATSIWNYASMGQIDSETVKCRSISEKMSQTNNDIFVHFFIAVFLLSCALSFCLLFYFSFITVYSVDSYMSVNWVLLLHISRYCILSKYIVLSYYALKTHCSTHLFSSLKWDRKLQTSCRTCVVAR